MLDLASACARVKEKFTPFIFPSNFKYKNKTRKMATKRGECGPLKAARTPRISLPTKKVITTVTADTDRSAQSPHECSSQPTTADGSDQADRHLSQSVPVQAIPQSQSPLSMRESFSFPHR